MSENRKVHDFFASRVFRGSLATGAAMSLAFAATPLLNSSLPANAIPAEPAPATTESAPTAGDTTQDAARSRFETVWDNANAVVPFSTGSIISSCTPGQANPEATTKMLMAWNYMRSLNGLAPIEIPLDSPASAPAQAAALTAAIGPVASPNPAAIQGAACVTDDVQLASSAGVIARLEGIVTPATEILRYITEASTSNSNDNLGHRLELFAPQQARAAIGAVSIGTSGPTASSLQLFDSSYQQAGRPLDPPLWEDGRPSPNTITWPAAGFFPTKLLPTGANESISRWSFSARCSDLRSAKVTLTGPNGAIPLEVIRRNEPGVDPSLTPWDYAGYDTVLFKVPLSNLTIPEFYATSKYQVSVTGIQPAAGCTNTPTSASYTVDLFNSSWPADPYGDADGDGIENYQDPQPHIPDLHTNRIAGADRIETAAKIALATAGSGNATGTPKKIYLARSDILVDALVGGALKDGPVLLLPPEGHPLPDTVTSVIKRLNPEEIIALGGPAAVSDSRLYEVAAGRKATRLGGSNRVATSIIIARRAGAAADSLYLAQAFGPGGSASPDALAGAALSDGPIVLVDSSAPTIATIRQLAADLQVKRVVALGGPGAVPVTLLSDIAVGRAATRLAGPDRYATSREVSREAYRLRPTTRAYLARGDVFADAVAGGKLSDGPLLLLPPKCQPLDRETLKTLSEIQAFQVTALGGESAVCEANLQATLQWPDVVNETVTEF